MCADKLRELFPVPIRFSEGEMADPTKFDGGFLQTANGLSIVEYAIGDLWNNGGDAFIEGIGLTNYALMIPNVARSIGIFSLLNPRLITTDAVTQYTHKVVSADVGKYELQLSLPPTGATSFTWSGTSAPSGSPETSLSDVNATGEWYVDRTTGQVFCYDIIQSDWTVAYIPTVAGDAGDDATANIIPDPNTNASYAFQGCKIAYTNNVDNSQGYIIFLPPRGPLSDTRRTDRSPQSQYDASSNTANEATSPGSLPVKMWQSDTVAATTGSYAEHYRYALPKIITDNWQASSVLPAGLLHLWDPSGSGTTIDGLTFAAENAGSPRKYALIVSGTAIDSWVSSYMSTVYAGCGGTAALTQRDTHTSAYYPAGGLRVVTAGNSIASAVSKLAQTMLEHDHGSANSQPGKLISHGNLADLFDPAVATNPRILPSSLPNDDHPQYIHRKGLNVNTRDQYNNGILGDLYLTSIVAGSGDYNNLTNDSYAIRFGHTTSGPALHYDQLEDALQVDNTDFYVQGGVAKHTPTTVPLYGYPIVCDMISANPGSPDWTYGVHNKLADSPPHWKSSGINSIYFELSDWPEYCLITAIDVWCEPNGTGAGGSGLTIDGYLKVFGANAGPGLGGGSAMTSIGNQVDAPEAGTTIIKTFVPNITYQQHRWTHGYHASGTGEKPVIKITPNGIDRAIFGIRIWVFSDSISKWAG